MAENAKITLKAREVKTRVRFTAAANQSKVLLGFFDKGFRNFESVRAIVLNFYPGVSEKKLWDFWHFRSFDQEVLKMLEDVFERISSDLND